MEIIKDGVNCNFKTDILNKMLEQDSPKRARAKGDHNQNVDGGKITLNVGGTRFETTMYHFASIPGSRLHGLSILKTSDISYDAYKNEYFFDRNGALFPYILDLYRNPDNELHFPHCICGPIVQRELKFWNISDDRIAPCCWKFYKEFEDEKETLEQLEVAFSGSASIDDPEPDGKHCWEGWHKIQRSVWDFLENPSSSLPAKIWAYFFLLLILMSSVLVVIDTHPAFRVPHENNIFKNLTNPKTIYLSQTRAHPVIKIICDCITFIFLAEIVLRFLTCPSPRIRFFKSFFNIFDIISVVPSSILTTAKLLNSDVLWRRQSPFAAYMLAATFRVLRIVRIFKIVRHNKGLQLIVLAIKASGNVIALLFTLLGIGMLIFSTIIYHAQITEDDDFDTVPSGIWWSIVTMTTVGYGDMVPTTTMGRFVGIMCAITGIFITGLPIPIVASNFNHYYKCAKLRKNMEKKGKKSRHGYSISV